MKTEKIRGIAFIVIGAISVYCKLRQGIYDSNYAFYGIVTSLGNILLVIGLVLLTLGITKLMDLSEKEKKETQYQSKWK